MFFLNNVRGVCALFVIFTITPVYPNDGYQTDLQIPTAIKNETLTAINGGLIPIHTPDILGRSLTDFKEKYPQFNYGIRSMAGLYDAVEKPEEFYPELNGQSLLKSIVHLGEVIVVAACSVIRTLSAFHNEQNNYGEVLMGLHIGKLVLWIIDSYLSGSSQQRLAENLNALHPEPRTITEILELSSQVKQADFSPVISTADTLIKTLKGKTLTEQNRKKLDRLTSLYRKLKRKTSSRNIILDGGQILSGLTGTATGISIEVSGQKSPPSYWLTLVSGGLDSITTSLEATVKERPNLQTYIIVSEILFLLDDLITAYEDYNV